MLVVKEDVEPNPYDLDKKRPQNDPKYIPFKFFFKTLLLLGHRKKIIIISNFSANATHFPSPGLALLV